MQQKIKFKSQVLWFHGGSLHWYPSLSALAITFTFMQGDKIIFFARSVYSACTSCWYFVVTHCKRSFAGQCRAVLRSVGHAAVSFMVFPRESSMMSSCLSSTVKTPFPGVTAELQKKRLSVLLIYFPMHSIEVFSAGTLTSYSITTSRNTAEPRVMTFWDFYNAFA